MQNAFPLASQITLWHLVSILLRGGMCPAQALPYERKFIATIRHRFQVIENKNCVFQSTQPVSRPQRSRIIRSASTRRQSGLQGVQSSNAVKRVEPFVLIGMADMDSWGRGKPLVDLHLYQVGKPCNPGLQPRLRIGWQVAAADLDSLGFPHSPIHAPVPDCLPAYLSGPIVVRRQSADAPDYRLSRFLFQIRETQCPKFCDFRKFVQFPKLVIIKSEKKPLDFLRRYQPTVQCRFRPQADVNRRAGKTPALSELSRRRRFQFAQASHDCV